MAVLPLKFTPTPATPAFAAEHAAAAFENALIGMALFDCEGALIKANAAYCDFLGYSQEELYGIELTDIVPADELELDLRLRRELLAGSRGSYRRDKRYLHRSGRVLWADFSCTLVRAEPPYFVGQALDIGDRKAAEDALKDEAKRQPKTDVLERIRQHRREELHRERQQRE